MPAEVEWERYRELADLWLDGAIPGEVDLRIAKSLAVKLAEFEGLRPFPRIIHTLTAYVSTPEFKVERVRELIESDPALAAHLMKVANSAAFRAYEACTSVASAILRVGAVGIVDLSMGISAMTLFKDVGGMGRRIRDHSAGTAAVARELLYRLDQGRVSSQIFLVGLLHDIGKLLLLQTGDKDYADMLGSDISPGTLHLKEQAHWGYDHAVLGAHVLRLWNLPSPIPQIIASHHQGKADRIKNPEIARAIDLLRVADTVEWLLAHGVAAKSPLVRKLADSPDGVRAGIDTQMLHDIWEDLFLARQESLSVFR